MSSYLDWYINMSWVKAIQYFRKIAFCQNRISESNGLQIYGRLTLFAGTQKVNYYTSFQHLLQFYPFKKCTNVWQALLKAQIWCLLTSKVKAGTRKVNLCILSLLSFDWIISYKIDFNDIWSIKSIKKTPIRLWTWIKGLNQNHQNKILIYWWCYLCSKFAYVYAQALVKWATNTQNNLLHSIHVRDATIIPPP